MSLASKSLRHCTNLHHSHKCIASCKHILLRSTTLTNNHRCYVNAYSPAAHKGEHFLNDNQVDTEALAKEDLELKDPKYSGNFPKTHKEEYSQEKKQDPPNQPIQSYTQPEHGRPVLDVGQGFQDFTYEGVQTVYDSRPPQDYSMKHTDDPHHPTGAPDVVRTLNQDELGNSTLMRHVYKDIPKALDENYTPTTLPSGFKDEESGQIYWDTRDKYLNTIPMRGLEDKFIDPDDFNPVEVTSNVARCDGTNRVTEDLEVVRESELDYRMGHPKVFIKLDRLFETKRCPYCGVQYKRVPTKRLEAEPFDVEKLPEDADNNEWFNMLEHKKHAKPRGHH